jgi:surface carbohydrate biosynthesis protein (TIGR04326 family)
VDSLRLRLPLELVADVIFVQYWPTPKPGITGDTPTGWMSPYFREFPEALAQQGLSVGFLHLHADGRVTRAPRSVRRQVKLANLNGRQHLLLSDSLSINSLLRALIAWLRVQVLWSLKKTERALPKDLDVERLWKRWKHTLYSSIRGSHAVRNALLTEMFAEVVSRNPRTKVWVSAFEGQSWESCLARVLDEHGARWLPYLHTMMRPWDLRAHTYLAEAAPEYLALHGIHDRDELMPTVTQASIRTGKPVTRIIDVEALRYQHLLRTESESTASRNDIQRDPIWLVVGGAECKTSETEFEAFADAVCEAKLQYKIVARWHPQCRPPDWMSHAGIAFSTEPLAVLSQRASAAIMVGLAAPLDTYLSGLPSCSFASSSGLSMSPISENELHHVAANAHEAVKWMLEASGKSHRVPDPNRYFYFDSNFCRWKQAIEYFM